MREKVFLQEGEVLSTSREEMYGFWRGIAS